jgi:hypothetical protein
MADQFQRDQLINIQCRIIGTEDRGVSKTMALNASTPAKFTTPSLLKRQARFRFQSPNMSSHRGDFGKYYSTMRHKLATGFLINRLLCFDG